MAQCSADRNLLFGILALQMDFVTRDALVGAGVLDRHGCGFLRRFARSRCSCFAGHAGIAGLILLIISHLVPLPFAKAPNRALISTGSMDHAPRLGAFSATSPRVVDVLVPVALNQTYSYRVPRGMELRAGDVVGVPLGPREVLAVVWGENANPDPRLHNRLKDVTEKLDVPPLKGELRSLVDWVANYTLSSRGMVLRMCLRMGEHLGPERVRLGVRLIGAPPQR